jgi:hypothetical protein
MTEYKRALDSNPYASPKSQNEAHSEDASEYSGKLYNTLSIAIATIFGSVLASGLLIQSNYNHLQLKQPALITAVCTALLTLAFMFSLFIIEFPLVMSFLMINFVIAVLLLPLNQALQGKLLEQHEDTKREFHSYFRASFIGVGCALAMLVMLLIASTMYVLLLGR